MNKTIICPNCMYQNDADNNYCEKCGQPLCVLSERPEDASFPPNSAGMEQKIRDLERQVGHLQSVLNASNQSWQTKHDSVDRKLFRAYCQQECYVWLDLFVVIYFMTIMFFALLAFLIKGWWWSFTIYSVLSILVGVVLGAGEEAVEADQHYDERVKQAVRDNGWPLFLWRNLFFTRRFAVFLLTMCISAMFLYLLFHYVIS